MCEVLRSNLKSKDICANTDIRARNPCVGCHQHNICVCMSPPTHPAGTSRMPIQGSSSSRKRSHTYDHQRKGLAPPAAVTTYSSPTIDKSNKGHFTPKPTSNIAVRFSEMEWLSPVSMSTSLGTVSQTSQCSNGVDLQEVMSDKLSQEPCQNYVHDPHCLNPLCASPPVYPPLVYDLLLRLLDPNPASRITTEEALAHPFLNRQAMI